MKIHSYTGPYTATDADEGIPSLDINVEIAKDEVHYAAIQVHGDECIAFALTFLTFMKVSKKS